MQVVGASPIAMNQEDIDMKEGVVGEARADSARDTEAQEVALKAMQEKVVDEAAGLRSAPAASSQPKRRSTRRSSSSGSIRSGSTSGSRSTSAHPFPDERIWSRRWIIRRGIGAGRRAQERGRCHSAHGQSLCAWPPPRPVMKAKSKLRAAPPPPCRGDQEPSERSFARRS